MYKMQKGSQEFWAAVNSSGIPLFRYDKIKLARIARSAGNYENCGEIAEIPLWLWLRSNPYLALFSFIKIPNTQTE